MIDWLKLLHRNEANRDLSFDMPKGTYVFANVQDSRFTATWRCSTASRTPPRPSAPCAGSHHSLPRAGPGTMCAQARYPVRSLYCTWHCNSPVTGPICWQLDGDIPCQTTRVQSEDCLTLDVYTATYNTFTKAPVIVWLHGGVLKCLAHVLSSHRAHRLAHCGVLDGICQSAAAG